ncbi:uncharacterized protein LOC141639661 [Silene latifolia]|uniref:uncharacterized protein LOC141639661 n=1 Tax=Silene latifolia TaxID=37657 RepID=UPI003D778257
MGQLRVTNMTLQMADRYLNKLMGVLEDVPVRVGKYFIPLDFIVMEMAEDSHVPIILGRQFLHTAEALIDVRDGSLTLRVGDDTVKFVLDNALKRPHSVALCYMLNIVDPAIHDSFTLYFDMNPSDAPTVASGPWSKKVDEIEKFIYGDEPHPERL